MLRFLKVQLELLAQGYNNDIRSAQKETKEFEKTVRPMKDFVKDLGVAMVVAGGAVVGSMTAMAKSAADYGDRLNDASKRTGESVQDLAKLKFAAEQSGASFDDVSTGLRVLANNMDAANTGSKAQIKTFKDLGISVTDSAGKLRPLNAVMLDVADKFARMQDGAQKAALAQELFGRGGAALIPTLNEGRAGLRAMGDQAQRLGLVISDDAARASDEFNDSLDQMRAAGQGLANTIGAAILPSLTDLSNKARDLVTAFKDWAAEHPGLTKAILATAGAITGTGGLLIGVAGLISALPKLTGMVSSLAAVISPLGVAVLAVGGAIAYFRKELVGGFNAAVVRFVRDLEEMLGALQKITGTLGFQKLSDGIADAKFKTEDYRMGLEAFGRSLNAIRVTTEDVKDETDKSADSYKRAAAGADELRKKLVEQREELERNRVAFERSARLDLWRSTTAAIEEEERALRGRNKEAIDGILDEMKLRKELADSIRDINERTQEELDNQLRLTNKLQIDAIKDRLDKEKKAQEEQKRLLKEATEDIKRSAGAVFDAMFLKGESVFKSLTNALKGGALSIGRAIFEDVTGALLGPVKKAFDDFLGGILGGISNKLGSVFGDLLGVGSGAARAALGAGTSAAASAAGAASSLGGGAASAAGSAGSLATGLIGAAGGVIGGVISAIGSARLEGTMNAVEYNTRVSAIHLGVLIDQIMWPIHGLVNFIASQQGEHSNQLDAIYNRLGEFQRTSVTQTNSYEVNVTVGVGATSSFVRDEVIPQILDALKKNSAGSLEQLNRILKNSSLAVVSA